MTSRQKPAWSSCTATCVWQSGGAGARKSATVMPVVKVPVSSTDTSTGEEPVTTVGGNLDLYHLLLPGFVLGAVSFAYIVRLTRSEVADNLTADYVRTASAKGLRRPRVITVHVLRNSLIPVVTFIGTDVGVLMGGAVVTEGIFNIPGVGGTIYQAVIRGEAPTVVSFVTVLVLIYLVCNIVVDLLYAALDPRIRYA